MASGLVDWQTRMRGFTPRRAIAAFLVLAVQLSLPLIAQDRLLPVLYFRQVRGLDTDEIRSTVVRDHEGFVWIGTLSGLDRWDGYSVKKYRHDRDDAYSISSSGVMALLVDTKGRLWTGTAFSGLSLYDRTHDRFINFIPRPGDSSWYGSKFIWTLLEDHSGNIWMGTGYGGVVRAELPQGDCEDLDSLARGIHFTTFSLGTPRNGSACLLEREDGKILAGSDSGVIVLDPATHAVSRLHLPDRVAHGLDSLPIKCMQKDSHGNLWIAGSEGLFRIGRDGNDVANYRHREGDAQSIRSDTILQIAEDRRGNLWLAGGGGVDLFSPSTGRCIPYLTIGSDPGWPVEDLRLSLDSDGVLWLGMYEGGLHWLSPKSRRFPLLGLRDGNSSNPIIFWDLERDSSGGCWFMSRRGVLYGIDIKTQEMTKRIDVLRGKLPLYNQHGSFIDKRGLYWYGVSGFGLYRVDLKSGEVRNYSTEAGLRGKTVNWIAEGEGDTLWIAAYLGGLMKFAIRSEKFIWVKGLGIENVWSVMKDRKGKIWIGSEVGGLLILDPATGATERFTHNPSDPRSLSADNVRFTYEDPSGRVWVGAGSVVHLWDSTTHSFTRYDNPEATGGQFYDLLGFDGKGRLWVSYLFGDVFLVAVLDPSSGAFTNFDMTDGVDPWPGMLTLPDGRALLNNGYGGVNIFHPDSIDIHRPPPSLVITGMTVNDVRTVPPRSISPSTPLRLPYSQNVLEFEFAAIDIDAPRLVEYRYMLEGLEKEWVKPKDRRFVRYPGLSPGDYVFKVEASSARREWADQEIALAISIAPPWWRTIWAYGGYGLLVVSLLFAAFRVRLRQAQLKQKAEMEHFHAEHLAEVDRMKSRFFSNISHEFRTPLTLILGPIQKWRDRAERKDEQTDLAMAEHNAHRLLRLVNQLLDLSKLEAGAMTLRASRVNVVPLVRGIANSFESSAGLRGISLSVLCDEDSLEAYCDRDMTEKILTNLLSNAFKFTPEGGTVEVRVSSHRTVDEKDLTSHQPMKEGGEWMSIVVSDTGVGIPADQLDKVFDRFYQVDASQTREFEGSGLGLALVKELVELHHGSITVASEVGKGTSFTVQLPLGRSHLKDEEIAEISPTVEPMIPEFSEAPGSESAEGGDREPIAVSERGSRPIILVVEDNADVRTYMRSYLIPAYEVKESRDGAEGVEMAVELIPDLIVSDVMMPKKGGYDLCRTLKNDERTSHIPIILLTAKAGSESKFEGLETGADDYLVKPFEPKELLARIKNLIDMRRRLRERFSVAVPLRPGEIAVTSMDDAFLKKVMSSVEAHIGDEHFSVEQLSQEVFMSRVQLHRKLTVLTNQSASEFIRYIRLHRAMDLLQKNAGTIAEIANSVGFSNPSHFSTRFREQFGLTPGEVRRSRDRAPS